MVKWFRLYKSILYIFALGLAGLSLSSFAQQGPAKLNISGSLFNSNGTFITNNQVNLKIEIRDKADTCTLYSEQHLAVDLSATKGAFSLIIGSGTSPVNHLEGTTAFDAKLFENNGVVAPFTGCVAGVTLAVGEDRLIRVSYDLGSGFVAMTPDVPIVSSAYAMVAETLQGKTPQDFILSNVNSQLQQANVEYIFSNLNYPTLKALVEGTATQYISSAPTSAVSLNSQNMINVADPSSAQDVATKHYADLFLGGKSVDVSGVGVGVGGGRTLIWDQILNKWVTQAIGGLAAITGGTGLNGGTITTVGTLSVDVGVTANKILQLNSLAQIPAVDGSLVTNVNAIQLQARNVSAALPAAGQVIGWNSTSSQWEPVTPSGGTITALTGDVSASGSGSVTATIQPNAVTSAKINNAGVAVNRLLITDATTGATIGYSTCGLGELLQWTASGWACTPVNSVLGPSGVTASTYGNSVQVAQVSVDSQGRVTALTNVNIAFPVTSVAGHTGAVTLNAADISGLGTAATQDYGTGANQLLPLNASAQLPAVDGSLLTNVNATKLQSRDVAATAPGAGQVLGWNNSSLKWEPTAASTGSVTSITGGSGLLGGTINSAGTLSVDVGTGANKILQLNASAQIPAVDGSLVTNVNASKIIGKSLSGAPPTAGQILTYNNLSAQWEAEAPSPAAADFVNGGNNYGAPSSLGNKDPFSLTVLTNNAARMTFDSAGNVGIGTTTPNSLLDVAGILRVTTICDSSGLNCKTVSGGWGAGGSVTDVSAGTGLTGGDISTAGTLNVDVGTAANKILQVTSLGQYPSVDGNLISNINAIKLQARNVSASAPGGGQVLGWNSTSVQWEPSSVTSGTVVSVNSGTGLTGGPITANGTLNVDVGTAANKILQLTASAQIPAVDGFLVTNINASKLIGKSISGTAPTSAQVLTFNSVSAQWEAAAVTAAAGDFVNGGNSFGDAASLGTNDSNTLSLKTDGSARLVIDQLGNVAVGTTSAFYVSGSGNVGIGTAVPAAKLEVDGQIYSNLKNGNELVFNEVGTNFGAFYGDGANNRLYFGATNNPTTAPTNPLMTWDLATGYIGIGTQAKNPTFLLDVNGPADANIQARIIDSTTAHGGLKLGAYGFLQTHIDAANNYDRVMLGSGVNYDSVNTKYDVSSNAAYDRAAIEFENGGDIDFLADTGDRTGAPQLARAQWKALSKMIIKSSGNVGIGTSTPTAVLHLKAGSTTVSSAPLKFTSSVGSLLATKEDGAMEYDGTNYYLTVGTNRSAIPLSGGTGTYSVVDGGAGSAAAPSFAFAGDTNTGLYDAAVGTLGVAAGGVQVMNVTSTAVNIAANKNLTMTSGTGQFSQTYSGTGPAASITDTAAASGDILDLATTSTVAVNNDKALNIAVSGANGTGGVTRYGAYSNVTATGATSTNVGGYFSASGASNNYGLLVANGNVGIGTSSPTVNLQIQGSSPQLLITATNGTGTEPVLHLQHWTGDDMMISAQVQDYFFQDTDGNQGTLQMRNSTNAVNVQLPVHTSKPAYILSNVGVGTTSPGSSLTVIGTSSLGNHNTVTGATAFATGDWNSSLGQDSFVAGGGNSAAAAYGTMTMGFQNTVTGSQSMAIGNNLTLPGYESFYIGAYNVTSGSESQWTWIGTDPLFVIGNGTGAGAKSNAMTVLKNGNVGIGTMSPQAVLDITAGASATEKYGAVLRNTNSVASSAVALVMANTSSIGNNFTTAINGITRLVSTRQADDSNNFQILQSPGGAGNVNANMTIVGATGNVGIGTTSPSTKLEVAGTSAAGTSGFTNISNFTGNGLRIDGSAVSATDAITYQSGASGGGAALEFGRGNNWGTFIAFATNPTSGNSVGAMTERVRIDANGNVGIGTTSPGSPLEVNGIATVRNYVDYYKNSTHAGKVGSASDFTTEGGASDLGIRTNANIYFATNDDSNSKMVLTAAGNVGVGTTTPAVKMDVKGSAVFRGPTVGGLDGELYYNTASHSYSYYNAGASAWQSLSSGNVTFTGSTWGLNGSNTYYNSGYVGIGTTNPVTALDIEPAAGQGIALGTGSYPAWMGNAGIYLTGQVYAVGGYIVGSGQNIHWGDSSTSIGGVGNAGSDYLNFTTESTEKMRILGNGNVGIGTTSPLYNLDIQGVGVRFSSVFGDEWFKIDNGSVSFNQQGGTTIIADGNNSSYGVARVSIGTLLQPGRTPLALAGYTGQTAPLFTVDTDETALGPGGQFMITSNGKVGIGTTSPVSKVDINGSVRIAMDATACAAGMAGAIRYNSGTVEYCNGASWTALGAVGSTIDAGNGTAAAPSLSFSSDTGTGFYRDSAGVIGVSSAGTEDYKISAASIASTTTGGAMITSGNGTAAAPAFSFTGDAGTGWFRPAASMLAASTGGTERVRIDSSGNVGVGTTSPGYLFHVMYPAQASTNAPVDVMAVEVTAPSSGTRLGYGPSIIFKDFGGAANSMARIASVYENSGPNQAGALSFYTNPYSPNSLVERMRIDNTGNVGIGTTSPGQALEVNGTAKVSGVLSGDGTAAAPSMAFASDTGTGFYNAGSHWIGVSSNGSQILTFNSSGVFGTGAMTVAAGGVNQNLTLNSAGTGSINSVTVYGKQFSVLDPGVPTGNFITVKGSALGSSPIIATAGGDPVVNLTFSPKGTGNTIFSSGNVGIGTTSPSVSLDVGSKTDAIASPSGTTAQRPGTPVNGMIRYNSSLSTLEGYMYGAWTALNNAVVGRVDITSTPYTITSTQPGIYFNYNNAAAGVINLPSLATLPDGWQMTVMRKVAQSVTLTPNGGDTFDNGITTLEMQGNNIKSVTLTNNGGNWTITNQTQDCIVGQSCWGTGNIYVGTYNGHQYFTTPGNCVSGSPYTCNGATDTTTKAWATGAPESNTLENLTNATDGKTQTVTEAAFATTQAAQFCNNINSTGGFATYNDWYLPASQELGMLYRASPSIGGFVYSSNYWSSNEFSTSNAWGFTFGSGAMGGNGKTTAFYVRCVRRF